VLEVVERMDPDAGTFLQVDVLQRDPAHDVEDGHESPASFRVEGLGEEDRADDLDARLLPHLAPDRFLDGLVAFDGTPEPRPATGVDDVGPVVAEVEEEPAVVGDDEQDGGPPGGGTRRRWHPCNVRPPPGPRHQKTDAGLRKRTPAPDR
jgi:hypothetical protein